MWRAPYREGVVKTPSFVLLHFGEIDEPTRDAIDSLGLTPIALPVEGAAAQRYDARPGTCYLMRPDQHVAARWRRFDAGEVRAALARATGH